MTNMSKLNKYLLIPSIILLGLGFACLGYSKYLRRNYQNFIEMTRQNPIIAQADSLNEAIHDLDNSRRALTHYLEIVKPMIYHDPNISESLERLDAARTHMERYRWDLDEQISRVQGELERTKNGQLKKSYESHIRDIGGIERIARDELRELEEKSPKSFKERNLLKEQKEHYEGIAGELSLFGIFGIWGYVLLRKIKELGE